MVQDQSRGNGAERRAHARYNIDLSADVSLADGRDRRSARILDYCIGGLFLNVEGQDGDFLIMGAVQVARDTLLKLRFQAPASGSGAMQEFELGLRVCRLFIGGMGVAFDPTPDPAAILSLQALAEAAQVTQTGGFVAGDHVHKAIEMSHQHLHAWIKDHLNRLFKAAANDLFIEARDATNNEIQNASMDAMKNVDRVKPAVCEDALKSYQQAMGLLFPQLAAGTDAPVANQGLGLDSELSLVDTGSFDDWVTVKNMMTRAEPKLREPLYDLSRRFSTLTTATIDELSNPAGIQLLCMNFNEAMQNLGLQRPARNAIYTSFEKVLIADLADLYKDLNKKLVDHGVLPEVHRPKPGKVKRSAAAPQRQAPAAGAAEHEQPEGHGDSGIYSAYEGPGPQYSEGVAPPQGPAAGAYAAPPGAQATAPAGPPAAPGTAPATPQGGQFAPPGNYSAPPQPAYTQGQGQGVPPQTYAPGQGGQGVPPQTYAPGQGGQGAPPQTYAPGQGGQGAPPQAYAPGQVQGAPQQAMPATSTQVAGNQAAVQPVTAESARQAIQNYTPAYQSPIQAAVPQVPMAQAYQAARSLMGLQRAVASGEEISSLSSTGSLPPAAGAVSAPVMGALNQLQKTPEFNAPAQAQGLHLRERLEQSLAKDGIQLSGQEREAVQVLSSLLESILTDPLIHGNMKPRIQRLAVPLTKVALQDEGFFTEEQHPARQVVNRLGMLGLPDELADNAQGDSLRANIDPLLERILADPHATPQTFESVLPDLDALIQRQQSQFSENIENLVENRTQQQAVLASRRQSPGTASERKVSADLQPWFQRTERLKVGDVLAFNADGDNPQPKTLAWVNEARDAYVFADSSGRQTSSVGQQELAVEMLRGSTKVLESADVPAMDRGVYDMLHKIHRDLSEEAERDSVTGLMSGSAFEKVLEEAINRAQRRGSKHALLSLNLDGFSSVNDQCGRKAGDSLLRKLSRLLSRQLEDSGAITRLHADEFMILLLDHNYRDAKRFADRQCRAIENSRVVFQGEQYPITASLGLLPVTRAGVSVRELIDNVQSAMRVAKQHGGNQVHLYDPDEQPAVGGTHTGPDDPEDLSLKAIFEQQGLVLMQQKVRPIVETDEKIHRQILIGRKQPDNQVAVVNRELIVAAEMSGNGATIDRWVIRDTLAWMSEHRPKLLKSGGYALRLSAGTFKDADLLDYVVAELTESSVPPAKVIFIIPESVAIDRLSSAVEFISSLKEYGCRFAIDDFGSGHTTFSYLKTLPVDFVRIDSGFVSNLEENDSDYAMVKSINEIAHLLGKKTIAEGVINAAVNDKLKELGVDYVQGIHAGEATLLD